MRCSVQYTVHRNYRSGRAYRNAHAHYAEPDEHTHRNEHASRRAYSHVDPDSATRAYSISSISDTGYKQRRTQLDFG